MGSRKQDYIKPRDGEVAMPTTSFSTTDTLVAVNNRGSFILMDRTV